MTKSRTPLKDVISTDVVYINPQDTLREALNVIVENHVSALPVVDAHQRCVGVVLVTDLLGMTKDLSDELNALSESGGLDHESLVQKLEHAELLTEQVQGWMSTDVISVEIDSTIQHAAQPDAAQSSASVGRPRRPKARRGASSRQWSTAGGLRRREIRTIRLGLEQITGCKKKT